MEIVFVLIFGLIFIVLWFAVIFLPGAIIARLVWKSTGSLRPRFFQSIVRAAPIAVAITPGYYAHNIFPAIFVVFFSSASERKEWIIFLLIVWAAAIPFVHAFERYCVKRDQLRKARAGK